MPGGGERLGGCLGAPTHGGEAAGAGDGGITEVRHNAFHARVDGRTGTEARLPTARLGTCDGQILELTKSIKMLNQDGEGRLTALAKELSTVHVDLEYGIRAW